MSSEGREVQVSSGILMTSAGPAGHGRQAGACLCPHSQLCGSQWDWRAGAGLMPGPGSGVCAVGSTWLLEPGSTTSQLCDFRQITSPP